jgi:hypothetical protein
MSQRPSRFAGRGASSCHGSTSRAFATFAIQSRVGLVADFSTANTCDRDTPAKSARAVRATCFRFAVARTFLARRARSSRGSTPATVRAVRHHGIRYPGWSRGPRAATAGRVTGRVVPMDRGIVTAALFVVLATATQVLRGDDATPDAGAPPVCKPHANLQTTQSATAEAIGVARAITAADLASSAAMPDTVPGMLRQLAAAVECDKATITHWPTQQECMAMPTFCARGRPIADCRKDADDRSACLAKATAEDPRVTADHLIAVARAEADRLEPLIAAEVGCRASPKCMDRRAIAVVCAWVARRQGFVQDIADERANPSGVVDLARLHSLGEDLESARADLKTAVKAYETAQKKPFRESMCR